jgi:hypothetical protein
VPLEFPFVEVDDVTLVFGAIPNYETVLQACPRDFYTNNPFSRLAEKWFEVGELDPAVDLAIYEIRTDSTEDAINQRRYIETWLKSYRPGHPDKIAVSGWLISLMLEEPEQSPA